MLSWSKVDQKDKSQLFEDEQLAPEWIEIDANGVRVENEKDFGGPWPALELIKLLEDAEAVQKIILNQM